MEYRDDWNKSRERFLAFWNNELLDRCCISVTAPKKGGQYVPASLPSGAEDRIRYWTDGEWIVKRKTDYFRNTYFGGEAFPQIFVDLGAAGHAGFFKTALYEFDSSIWIKSSTDNFDIKQLEFDPDSMLYRKTLELIRYFVNESKGEFFVSMPDISGNLDALSHLRSPENLLIDLIEDEANVRHALAVIQNVWQDTSRQVYEITNENNDGGCTIGWLNTWAPGKHAQMQCDMSAMISPAMFERYALPELKSQSEWMDHSLYHLDGIEQIRFLDMLLSVKTLHAIQWTCVTGQPSPLKFVPVLKRIQAAGKGLVIRIKPEELEPLMEQLSSKGLYLILDASSVEEAECILKKAEKLTHE